MTFALVYVGIGIIVAHGWDQIFKQTIGSYMVDVIFWPTLMGFPELRDIVYCGWANDPIEAYGEYLEELLKNG